MDTFRRLCTELVEAWDSTAEGEYEDFGRAASYLVDWAREALAEPEPDPVAWMYQGEPSFDGTDWRETWDVTTDKRLAEFKATPDQPIPLFSIQPQPQ